MTLRENTLAILNYGDFDRLPLVHFGYWPETLSKWADEGHLSRREAAGWADSNPIDAVIAAKLGFDFNWSAGHGVHGGLWPPFIPRNLRKLENGHIHRLNDEGVVVEVKPGTVSIPAEVDHLLKTRDDWERVFRRRLKPRSFARLMLSLVSDGRRTRPYFAGGRRILRRPPESRAVPTGIFLGSMIGTLRNIVGVENLAYLTVDDPDLLHEMIDAFGDISYGVLEAALNAGNRYDYLHFWEDICYNHGPLVNPALFAERIVPHYRRITALARQHGIGLASVDCDGKIDALLPHWLEAGINVMFPVEVGTWRAGIAPWRGLYGREVRAVGGMDKVVFSRDRKAVEKEIERLKRLVDLGGFIPCPDHRIPPDAQWDNVRYYCDRMNTEFNS